MDVLRENASHTRGLKYDQPTGVTQHLPGANFDGGVATPRRSDSPGSRVEHVVAGGTYADVEGVLGLVVLEADDEPELLSTE